MTTEAEVTEALNGVILEPGQTFTAFPPPPVTQLLSRVMRDVTVVGKEGHNSQQDYNFRGIDGVINAVGPAFRTHGIVVMPEQREYVASTVEVGKNRTQMAHVRVTVAYHFHGPAGDELVAVVDGEAMDSGDKACAKAYSVAYRIALLQVLAIPTHQRDPDEDSYTRSDAPPTLDELAQAAGFPDENERSREHKRVAAAIKALPADQRTEHTAYKDEHGWPMHADLLDVLDAKVAEQLKEHEKPFEEQP